MISDTDELTSQARATLDAWRARGADRLEPVRFYFMEALERRAAGHSGEARRILDERLAALLDAYARDLKERAPVVAKHAAPVGPASARGALGKLVNDVANDAGRSTSWPDLEALDYFRTLWSTFSTERQLRQSLEQVPGNAGPLNSSSLVHRSLSLMRELSPGYLQQFLSYVDTLSWMEQMNSGSAVPDKDAPRANPVRKGGRNKAR